MNADDSEETRRKGLKVIDQSIQSQTRLIDDLVDVTRFSSVGVRLELENTDLRQIIVATLEEMRPSIEQKHSLEVTIIPQDYSAVVDKMRVQQVLRNLISNAIQYTPAGGHIGVTLERDSGWFRLTVHDSGKGLDPKELDKIFQPFWRSDTDTKGVGLGLYIAASLVEAHGGKIHAASKGLGLGAQFIVELPIEITGTGHIRITAAAVLHQDHDHLRHHSDARGRLIAQLKPCRPRMYTSRWGRSYLPPEHRYWNQR
jgi:signal transduction histidine kinase